MHRSTPRRISAPLALLIGVALLVKALIPAGWMPSAEHGFNIVICSEAGGTDASFAREAQRLFDAAIAGTASQTPDKDSDHPGKSAPCTFAGLAMPWLGAVDAGTKLPAPTAVQPILPSAAAVAVGRGLAAPPPPQTGPPLFA